MTDDSNRAPARGQPVPSMEDIMTSIRRMIVNEGDDPTAAPTPRPSVLPAQRSIEDTAPTPQLNNERPDTFRQAEPGPAADFRPAKRLSGDIPRPSFMTNTAAPSPSPAADRNETFPASMRQQGQSDSFRPSEPAVDKAEPKPAVEEEGLLSSAAAEASSSAFARLSEAMAPSRPRAPSLDELVVEMIRPMLKDWLDTNLPKLVERIVEEEVARLVKRQDR